MRLVRFSAVCALALGLSGCFDSSSSYSSGPFITTVGGTVAGLAGTVTVALGEERQQISSNGPFVFNQRLAEGQSYSVTVVTQPVRQTCVVVNGAGTVGASTVYNVLVNCATDAHAIGGTVSGLVGSVELQGSGGEIIEVTTDGSFAFPTRLSAGQPYNVSVHRQPAGSTCVVSDGGGIVGAADVTNIAVNCEANTHLVGGGITGLIGTLVLSNGTDTITTSTDGTFTFPKPVAAGATFAVNVQTQPATQTCSVSNGVGTMGAADVTNVTVVCSTNTYRVGGTVAGLIGSVQLQVNGGDTLTLNVDGPFQFPTALAHGSPYSVTLLAQPATQTCTVGNGSGTVGAGNVTNVSVTCATNAYTVGGTLSGLSGSATLQNNGADSLTLNTDGSFTFSTPTAAGAPYNVTVASQPGGQTCVVSNGTGIMGTSNVTNVSVSCTTQMATVSADARAIVPVNSGSVSLTVTNTSTTTTAQNVSASLPSGWTAVTQDASNCTSVAPLGSCTLTFTSTQPYVAQGGIEIVGNNVSSGASTALAFSVDGYLVFVVGVAEATVLDSANLADAPWGGFGTAVGYAAQSLINGAANTDAIVNALGHGPYAASSCASSTRGGVSAGTWYLPAACQLDAPTGTCIAGVGTAHSLAALGFLSHGSYWSSTETPFDPILFGQLVATDTGISDVTKLSVHLVRCAREISY
ncbi:DUF4369 domain-containing protein [Steroidobacter cummioxidans]|uniref:DUF4369 domain-containing protein n=1 Tax=Steroidobacter cummioxidans TaxID=1803913 RepID=UPI000E30DD44|nr:DUF4369 domain-containing protein [Steroidobacter cummioxidans]